MYILYRCCMNMGVAQRVRRLGVCEVSTTIGVAYLVVLGGSTVDVPADQPSNRGSW